MLKKILIGFAVVILAIHFVLPPIVLNRLNAYLAEFSPVYHIHIEDIDMNILRMAYGFDDVTIKTKENNNKFATVKNIDVSLAWTELLQGRVLTNVKVGGASIYLDFKVLNSAKRGPEGNYKAIKGEAMDVKEALFPVDVEQVSIQNSEVAFADIDDLPLEKQARITDFSATLTHITPASPGDDSRFWASGIFMKSAKLNAAGILYLKTEPMEWDIDLELRTFALDTANSIFQRYGPLTFRKGVADIFAEIKYEKGQINGYVKPFLSNVDIVGNKTDFSTFKHFLIEIVASLGELVFESGKSETISTKILLSGNKSNVTVDRKKAVAGLFRHAFRKEYTPQVEDSIHLERKLNGSRQ